MEINEGGEYVWRLMRAESVRLEILYKYFQISSKACHDKAINSAKQLRSLVEPLQMAAKGDNGNFGHLVGALSLLLPFINLPFIIYFEYVQYYFWRIIIIIIILSTSILVSLLSLFLLFIFYIFLFNLFILLCVLFYH